MKLYHAERGYGFLVGPDVPGDVFFHRSDCRVDPASLEPSSAVTFDLVEMANGQTKAVNVGPKT
jgi:cold shock CspA family protein